MTKNAKIWCSNLMMDTRTTKSIGYDIPSPPPKDHWVFRYQTGERIDPGELPDKLEPQGAMKPPPEVFKAINRVIVVREHVKTLLEEFRLGRTHLHDVTITQPGHVEPFEGQFYILNITEHRQVFAPQQSANAYRNSDRAPWRIRLGNTKLDLAVRSELPGDVDMWFDPNLADVIFVSARLAAAVKAAKIRNFKLYPCREAV